MTGHSLFGSPAQSPTAGFDVSADEWQKMAIRVQEAIITINELHTRLEVLNRLSSRLGNHGYPAFIKLLMLLSRNGSETAKKRLADTLSEAMSISDMPSGVLNAWGGSKVAIPGDGTPFSASQLMRHLYGGSPGRGLGPIEYLTVWYGQKTQRPYLTEDAYAIALNDIIVLFNESDDARVTYATKLKSEVEAISEGAYTRLTRMRFETLGSMWLSNHAPDEMIALVMKAY